MAVTGPERLRARWFYPIAQTVLLLAGVACLPADQSADIRGRLSEVANSLTAGDPAAAMAPFSKSCANYETIREYFSGLTNAFSIVNEVDVLDEADSNAESVLTVNWSITLSNPQNRFNVQRSAEIHVRFKHEKDRWKIVEFSPIGIFDPSQAQTATSPP